MDKNYRKIEFGAGDSIERAMNDLARFKERGELVYGEFNGQKLYSDLDELDCDIKKSHTEQKLSLMLNLKKNIWNMKNIKESIKKQFQNLLRNGLKKVTKYLPKNTMKLGLNAFQLDLAICMKAWN